MSYKATMPKVKAPEGAANVVVAFRCADGSRMEYTGIMAIADAGKLVESAVMSGKAYEDIAKEKP